MITTAHYACKNCKNEMEIEYDIGEHFCEETECPECGTPIPCEAFDDIEIDAISSLADRYEAFRD